MPEVNKKNLNERAVCSFFVFGVHHVTFGIYSIARFIAIFHTFTNPLMDSTKCMKGAMGIVRR